LRVSLQQATGKISTHGDCHGLGGTIVQVTGQFRALPWISIIFFVLNPL
jgi:hypothetical protein